MRAARYGSTCPDCEEPIEPGDPIGRIGLYYVCGECLEDFERENAAAAGTVRVGGKAYPISGQWEPA